VKKELLKDLGRHAGPIRRLFMALLALFAPGTLVVAILKGFLQSIEELDDEELKRLLFDFETQGPGEPDENA